MPHRDPLVYVIVVNWNGMKFLEDCFTSLQKSVYPNLKVLFVDNGSTDGSVKYAGSHFLKPGLIQLPSNMGFATANNVGIKHSIDSGAEYVVLLNNDTRVEADWLDEMVHAADEVPACGVCGAQQLTWDGRNRLALRFIPEWADSTFSYLPPDYSGVPKEAVFVSGFCMLLRSEALKSVGMFDERYFAGSEDLDLCLRMWKVGYSVLNAPSARVYHHVGGTSNSKVRMRWGYRNQLFTILKNYQVGTILRFLPQILRRWVFTRNRIALMATLDAIRDLPTTLKLRKAIQANCVMDDHDVFLRSMP